MEKSTRASYLAGDNVDAAVVSTLDGAMDDFIDDIDDDDDIDVGAYDDDFDADGTQGRSNFGGADRGDDEGLGMSDIDSL